jgi:hypothetical protein
MADRVKDQYTSEIYNELGYFATWLPGGSVGLGDFGPADGRLYVRQGSLKSLGFKFKPTQQGPALNIEFSSRNAVNVTVQVKGESKNLPNIPNGQAGIDLSFSRSGACVLVLRNAREWTIENLYQFQRDVLAYYKRHYSEWAKDFIVISSIVQAKSASIIIADDTSSHFSVATDADITAGLIDLANASLNFSVKNSRDVSTKIISQADLQPLFRAFRIKDSWLNGPRVNTLASADLPEEIGSDESPFEWASTAPPGLRQFSRA